MSSFVKVKVFHFLSNKPQILIQVSFPGVLNTTGRGSPILKGQGCSSDVLGVKNEILEDLRVLKQRELLRYL